MEDFFNDSKDNKLDIQENDSQNNRQYFSIQQSPNLDLSYSLNSQSQQIQLNDSQNNKQPQLMIESIQDQAGQIKYFQKIEVENQYKVPNTQNQSKVQSIVPKTQFQKRSKNKLQNTTETNDQHQQCTNTCPDHVCEVQENKYPNKNNPQFIGSRLGSLIQSNNSWTSKQLQECNGLDCEYIQLKKWQSQPQYQLKSLYTFQETFYSREKDDEQEKTNHKAMCYLLYKFILDKSITAIIYSDKTKHRLTQQNSDSKKPSLMEDLYKYLENIESKNQGKGFKKFYKNANGNNSLKRKFTPLESDNVEGQKLIDTNFTNN